MHPDPGEVENMSSLSVSISDSTNTRSNQGDGRKENSSVSIKELPDTLPVELAGLDFTGDSNNNNNLIGHGDNIDGASFVSGSLDSNDIPYAPSNTAPKYEPRPTRFVQPKQPAVNISARDPKNKMSLNFLPSTLGCEVSALDGIKQHLFHAGFQFNTEVGVTNTKECQKPDVYANGKIKSASTNPMLLNFNRHYNDEIESNYRTRLSLFLDQQSQPLYLTGKTPFKNLVNADYHLTRYSSTLKMEYKKLFDDDGNLNDSKGKVVGSNNTKLVRQKYFYSTPINATKRLKIDIIDLNDDDTLEVFISDDSFKDQYLALSKLMEAYYDVTLTKAWQKREMIPKNKVKAGMIVVALIYPHTRSARFIRARVLSFLKPVESKRKNGFKDTVQCVSVIDVDTLDQTPHSIPLGYLFYIDQSFMELPFLTTKCRLKGFTFFNGTGIVSKKFKTIVNIESKHFSAVFSNLETTSKSLTRELQAKTCIELFMGRGRTEQPVNYLFLNAIMDCLTPALEPMICKQVRISHCDSGGNFWFLVDNSISRKLHSYGTEIEKNLSNLKKQNIASISDDFFKNAIYVTRSSVDEKLHRVCVKEILYSENMVVVQFLDWGNEEVVDVVSGVYKARDIDKIYATIPAQALQVRIKGVMEVRNPEDIINCLQNVPILIKEVNNNSAHQLTTSEVYAYVESKARGDKLKIPLKNFVQKIYLDSIK